MKKKFVFMVILSLIISLPAGCGTSGKTAEPKAAIILKGLTTSYWFSVNAGAKQAAKDFQFDVDILSPTTADSNEQQLQLLEEAVNNGYDVICISPADSKGILSGIELANDAGIPIVNYATQISGDVEIAARMRIEDYDAAYKVTKTLCEEIGEGQVIILEGVVGQQNAQDKIDGSVAAISEYPGIELVASQTANWVRNEGYTVTENLLQAYPNIKGIIAGNDDMAMGAVQAVKEAGKEGEILITGMNCAEFVIDALEKGEIFATIDVMAYELGYAAVETAWKMATGQEYEPDIVIDTILCTRENVDDIRRKLDINV